MPEEKFKLSLRDGVFYQTEEFVGVRFERILDHPIEKVWAALTRPDQMANWLAPVKMEGRKGGAITLQMKGGTMGGEILRWEENSLLEYSWHLGSVVRWELLSEGEGRCRLLFTHYMEEKTSDNQLLGAATGWHYHMDVLALTLDGKKIPDFPIQAWDGISREAAARYTQALQELSDREPDPPFIMERVFDAPLSQVWKALTEPEEIKKWSFDMIAFRPERGVEFSFYGHADDTTFLHLCRVMDVIPERKLAYSWRYENMPGISWLTFELFPEGEKTRLKLTHEGLGNLAHGGKHFLRKSFREGWTWLLDKALKDLLEKSYQSV